MVFECWHHEREQNLPIKPILEPNTGGKDDSLIKHIDLYALKEMLEKNIYTIWSVFSACLKGRTICPHWNCSKSKFPDGFTFTEINYKRMKILLFMIN